MCFRYLIPPPPSAPLICLPIYVIQMGFKFSFSWISKHVCAFLFWKLGKEMEGKRKEGITRRRGLEQKSLEMGGGGDRGREGWYTTGGGFFYCTHSHLFIILSAYNGRCFFYRPTLFQSMTCQLDNTKKRTGYNNFWIEQFTFQCSWLHASVYQQPYKTGCIYWYFKIMYQFQKVWMVYVCVLTTHIHSIQRKKWSDISSWWLDLHYLQSHLCLRRKHL